MFKVIFLFLFSFLPFIHSESTSEECEYEILLKSWKSVPKHKKKFIMKNKIGKVILEGYLEWNLEENIWIFHYPKYIIKIENNKMIKYENNKTKTYSCSGFAKILAKPIEKWHEAMEFDSEIKMDETCYTSFKTNKSYMIICFTSNPFNIISITFSENKEDYVLYFE